MFYGGECLMVGINGDGYLVWVFDGGYLQWWVFDGWSLMVGICWWCVFDGE